MRLSCHLFLPKNHNPSLITRRTLDKSQLRDILQNRKQYSSEASRSKQGNYMFKKQKRRKHNLKYHVFGWSSFRENYHKIFCTYWKPLKVFKDVCNHQWTSSKTINMHLAHIRNQIYPQWVYNLVGTMIKLQIARIK